jgi:hypothetical protein
LLAASQRGASNPIEEVDAGFGSLEAEEQSFVSCSREETQPEVQTSSPATERSSEQQSEQQPEQQPSKGLEDRTECRPANEQQLQCDLTHKIVVVARQR